MKNPLDILKEELEKTVACWLAEVEAPALFEFYDAPLVLSLSASVHAGEQELAALELTMTPRRSKVERRRLTTNKAKPAEWV
jgi:hypothetical protein